MDTLSAYVRGAANRGSRVRVFDWHKAAQLIKEQTPTCVSAGLQSDWEWTGGKIWEDGSPVAEGDTYVYLASNWATPEIDIDGVVKDCWLYADETDGWNAGTYWPQSARDLLDDALPSQVSGKPSGA